MESTDSLPQPFTRSTLGQLGEKIAVQHLQHLGWQILAQNWRCPYGEIDIIAQDTDTIVFVEVRTRRGKNAHDFALESISPKKQARLRQLVEFYQTEHLTPEALVRVDVIAIALQPNGLFSLKLVKDALGW